MIQPILSCTAEVWRLLVDKDPIEKEDQVITVLCDQVAHVVSLAPCQLW